MPTKIRTFDFSLLVLPIIFTTVGVSLIYSLVMGTANDGLGLKQGMIAIVGLAMMLVFSFSDYRYFKGTAWIFYAVSLILLVWVYIFGKSVNGAMNWIDLKIFRLQPSELEKISLIFTLSAYFSNKTNKIKWQHILVSLLILLVPLALILLEPDLGTAIIICFIYITILLASKPTKSQIAVIVGVVLAIFICAFLAFKGTKPFQNVLHDYQRQRIAVFLKPDLDPYGRGYNVKQAQITIGSGNLIGKGLGKGSQSQLQFLPEAHTDFIFAGIAESFGFLGTSVFLVLYCFLLTRILEIGARARDNFGMLCAFGVFGMFFFQALISVGMNIGFLPVTGIPLPFMSYGGTSLLVSMMAVGLIQSVFIRHEKITF
ncbi:MAG: rod shape-determining protein RodA [Candidatus Berkelbacteria bacterium]